MAMREVSIAEAAALLGINAGTVRWRVKLGELKSRITDQGEVLVLVEGAQAGAARPDGAPGAQGQAAASAEPDEAGRLRAEVERLQAMLNQATAQAQDAGRLRAEIARLQALLGQAAAEAADVVRLRAEVDKLQALLDQATAERHRLFDDVAALRRQLDAAMVGEAELRRLLLIRSGALLPPGDVMEVSESVVHPADPFGGTGQEMRGKRRWWPFGR
ncbi:MAG: hypothetical protein HY331_18520 [Chloroflexi bacterium]|nr:hypothetical protein [Chloroflexota bacterium]